MTNTTIRPAEPRDGHRVFELLVQFVTSYKPQRDAFDANFPALIASPDANLLVAEAAGDVVGYALALRVPTLYANGDLWDLQELMVDPGHRNQGIGKLLLDRVIADARDQNAVEVTVVSRRAGPYYVRHGFTETASYFKLKLTDKAAP